MEQAPSAPPPSAEPPGERLDSWKEIAVYLNRDVTTVQRWEKKEKMPVHRHQHDRMGSVYAFRTELDAWAHGRTLTAAPDEGDKLASLNPPNTTSASGAPPRVSESDSLEPVVEPASAPISLSIWPRMLWLGLVVLAVLVVALVWMRGRNTLRAKPAAIKSIAVLPLKNLSGDPSQEYLADGMTESLIGRLSAIMACA
jgi:hypothetical protein